MSTHDIDLTIVISNYNTKELLKKNLASIFRLRTKITFEIIVVDDCSQDNSIKMVRAGFPQVITIRNRANLGYSKSYNIGTRKAKGRYILHLNSDIIFPHDAQLDSLLGYMDVHRKIGILGCKIIKMDGKLDLPCKRAFPGLLNIFFQTIGLAFLFSKNKIFGNYYLTFLDEDKIHEIDCVMGAFMLIRRKVIHTIGFLDENFFIYGEDIDYCYRAKQNNWKIIYYPHLKVQHHHGATTKKAKIRPIWLFHLAMFLYYKKHLSKKRFFVVSYLVYGAIFFRFISVLLLNLFKKIIPSLVLTHGERISCFII
ncbi:MAG TPA: glycosyltransferase family 2 protein [Patescibacteria group bacterium]|nr:glycosyltransferase family 2 protein [Patescibacteria group bacterium]